MKPAKLLLTYKDSLGVFRFLVTEKNFYTLSFTHSRKFFLESQIKTSIRESFELPEATGIEVKLGFREGLEQKEDPLRLYLAILTKPLSSFEGFRALSFPELVKELPKNKERLPFLKAFQVLSDDKSHLIEARELTRKEFLEEVQKNQKLPS